MKNKIKKLLLVFLASILFILANPNFLFSKGLGFLAWIYYLPVLLLIKKSSVKEIWIYGFLYGLLSFAGYSYWLLASYKSAYFFVIFGYGIILSIVFLLLKASEFLFPKNHFILQWLILCSYEYIKTLGFLGLNYGVTSYTQYNFKTIIQVCDLVGPFGLNLLIILLSCVIMNIGQLHFRKKELLYKADSNVESGISRFNKSKKLHKAASMKVSYTFLILWSVCMIFTVTYGIIKLNIRENVKTIKICAVQNNENPWENGLNVYSENVRSLINLTNEALELNPDIKLVVWPETAVVPAIVYNYENKKDEGRNRLVTNLLNYMNKQNCHFVIGNGHEVFEKGNKKYYNSALFFTPEENIVPPKPEVYSKMHLVPFSESFPWKQKFPEIYTMLVEHGSQIWEPGKEISVFNIDDFYFSTPICFEDTFTETGRKMYKSGARCFINLTNDSWSNSKACQNQHLAMAVFRSVENRVPTVRSTTSGVTCIINSKGQITKRTDDFVEACVIGDINIIDKNATASLYTLSGDVCGWFTVIITFALLLIKIFIVIIKKDRK